MSGESETISQRVAAALVERRARTARVAFVAAVALSVLGLGYYLADVLNPFLIALLLAYVLNPIVERLETVGVRRGFAVTVLFGGILVGLGFALVLGGVSAAEHLEEARFELAGERFLDERNLADLERMREMRKDQDRRLRQDESGRCFLDEDFSGARKEGLIERITTALAPRLRRIPQSWIESAGKALEAQTADALAFGVQASKGLQAFISQLWNFFGYVLLVPIYTFFLLLSLSDIQRAAAAHLPGLYRERVLSIARRVDRTLAAFFRGRLLVVAARTLVTWLGLWLLGVRFAAVIAIISGALSVVPLLGMIVGGLLAVAFAYEPGSWGARCVGVGVLLAGVETLEAVAFPSIMGRNVGLHPLVLILSIFCFGRIFGLFGVLLAVPIACVVKILFEEFVLPEIRALAAEAPEAKPPAPP